MIFISSHRLNSPQKLSLECERIANRQRRQRFPDRPEWLNPLHHRKKLNLKLADVWVKATPTNRRLANPILRRIWSNAISRPRISRHRRTLYERIMALWKPRAVTIWRISTTPINHQRIMCQRKAINACPSHHEVPTTAHCSDSAQQRSAQRACNLSKVHRPYRISFWSTTHPNGKWIVKARRAALSITSLTCRRSVHALKHRRNFSICRATSRRWAVAIRAIRVLPRRRLCRVQRVSCTIIVRSQHRREAIGNERQMCRQSGTAPPRTDIEYSFNPLHD